jgi:hypothetical protein
MKAKIRKTSEVVDVITYSGHTYRSDIDVVSYIDSKGNECVDMKMNRFWDFEDVEESLIDWEQRRYEISKDVLSAFLSNSNEMIFEGNPEDHAKDAVVFADALIKKLREHNK